MLVVWDVKWCPMSGITTPLGTQETVSLENSRLEVAARETLKFPKWSLHLIVAAVKWRTYCRYGVEHYPIHQLIYCIYQYYNVTRTTQQHNHHICHLRGYRQRCLHSVLNIGSCSKVQTIPQHTLFKKKSKKQNRPYVIVNFDGMKKKIKFMFTLPL